MNRPRMMSLPLALALAPLVLGACTDLKRAVGLEKVVPDEFAVAQGVPLAIPPDYTLRPPRPGATPTQQVPATEQARQTIFRAGEQRTAALPDADRLSPGENELLRRAGAAEAPRDIRDTVNREAQATAGPVDDSIVDKLLFWRSADTGPAASNAVIDPMAEAERLKLKRSAALPDAGLVAMSPAAAPAPSTAAPVAPPPAAAPPAAAPPPAAPDDLLGPPKIERRRDPRYI